MIQKQSPVIEANKQHIDSTGNDTRKQGHIPDPNSKIDKTVSKQQVGNTWRRRMEEPSIPTKNTS